MKVSAKDYAKAFVAAAKASPAADHAALARRLWRMVKRNKHWGIRRDIVREVAAMEQGVPAGLTVRVSTARALAEHERKALISGMRRSLGEEVDVVTDVKPHLLAGLVATVGDRRFDGSLKGRLDRLYRAMAGESR